MPEPRRSAKPLVPAVLGTLDIDTADGPAAKAAVAAFANEIEGKLRELGVKHYALARIEEGTRVHLEVIPCSLAPEVRTGAPPPGIEAGTSASEVADALERAIARPAPSAASGPPTAAGLAPKSGKGASLRKR